MFLIGDTNLINKWIEIIHKWIKSTHIPGGANGMVVANYHKYSNINKLAQELDHEE
jgi:hypothetical protein